MKQLSLYLMFNLLQNLQLLLDMDMINLIDIKIVISVHFHFK
jgi:hypothetical protein